MLDGFGSDDNLAIVTAKCDQSVERDTYDDGTVSDDNDKTVEYTYDGNSNILTLKAHLTGGGSQTTEDVYGVTTVSGSEINSNDILSEVKHPDPSTGNASTTDKEVYEVNALGQRISFTDRNGSEHTYNFDVVGRITSDAVATLASGVDGAVRRLETAYDTAGRAYLFTSYDAAASGNVVNEVQQEFNGLSQLITEYQEHGGAVNTSTSAKIQYAYSEMESSANHSRLTSMTYPDGRVLNYNYDAGLDGDISRLSSLSETSTTIEEYEYLGLGTVVLHAHPEIDIDLTYIKQGMESNGDAGDQYTGLDRFGRIVDQRWIDTNTSTHTDRFSYGHDRNSNRLYRDNLVKSDHSELYHTDGSGNGYDDLNQLTDFQRGTLNGAKDSISGTASRTQNWDFDALGNFDSVTTDSTTETRSHNKQNEITSISGATTPTFDSNGNMTGDESGNTLEYDAWNRLVEVKSGMATLTSYELDALNRRIEENPGTARSLFYSAQWQVIEERESGLAVAQQVWSPVYVDALILRDRDADANSGNGLEERLYAQHDANFNVTALVNTSGSVVERFIYDPYGAVSFLTAAWASQSSSSYDWIYLHQGGRFDSNSGLYHFRNRDFSPTLNRWVSLDPIGFSGEDGNLYGYVHNNPSNALDPSGLKSNMLYAHKYLRNPPPNWQQNPHNDPANQAFVGNGGLPNFRSVEQGGCCDCWLLAAIISMAHNYPREITKWIKRHPSLAAHIVSLPGTPYSVTITDNYLRFYGHAYAESNGQWAKLIEIAIQTTYYKTTWFGKGGYPTINTAWRPDTGIDFLSCRSSSMDMTPNYKADSINGRRNTRNAYHQLFSKCKGAKKMMTACTGSKPSILGLNPSHVYAIIDYDPIRQRVKLCNPHSPSETSEPHRLFPSLRPNQPPTPLALDGNGDGVFWLTLPQLLTNFPFVGYED